MTGDGGSYRGIVRRVITGDGDSWGCYYAVISATK